MSGLFQRLHPDYVTIVDGNAEYSRRMVARDRSTLSGLVFGSWLHAIEK